MKTVNDINARLMRLRNNKKDNKRIVAKLERELKRMGA